MSDRLESELARYDWASLRSFGDASALPNALRALAAAQDDTAASAVFSRVDGIAFDFPSRNRTPAAVAVAVVLARCLDEFSPAALPQALDLLAEIAGCDDYDFRIAKGSPLARSAAYAAAAAEAFDRYCDLLRTSEDPILRAHCIDLIYTCGSDLPQLRKRALSELKAALELPAIESNRMLLTNSIQDLQETPPG